jgi:secreted Zn-dependent insulinase-like peptidase
VWHKGETGVLARFPVAQLRMQTKHAANIEQLTKQLLRQVQEYKALLTRMERIRDEVWSMYERIVGDVPVDKCKEKENAMLSQRNWEKVYMRSEECSLSIAEVVDCIESLVVMHQNE